MKSVPFGILLFFLTACSVVASTQSTPTPPSIPATPPSIAASPTPDSSAQGRAYLALRKRQLTTLVGAFQSLAADLQTVGGNPNQFFDSTWQKDVLAKATIIQTEGNALQHPANAPPDLVTIDGHLASLGADLVAEAKDLTTAIYSQNPAPLRDAAPRLGVITGKITSLTAEMAVALVKYEMPP